MHTLCWRRRQYSPVWWHFNGLVKSITAQRCHLLIGYIEGYNWSFLLMQLCANLSHAILHEPEDGMADWQPQDGWRFARVCSCVRKYGKYISLHLRHLFSLNAHEVNVLLNWYAFSKVYGLRVQGNPIAWPQGQMFVWSFLTNTKDRMMNRSVFSVSFTIIDL